MDVFSHRGLCFVTRAVMLKLIQCR